jgi:hypothetical protein
MRVTVPRANAKQHEMGVYIYSVRPTREFDPAPTNYPSQPYVP